MTGKQQSKSYYPNVDSVGIELINSQLQLADNLAIFTHEQASGTAGGQATSGSWQTCPINTVRHNPGSWASLAANQITLAAGTYIIRASQCLYQCGAAKIRVRNITDGATIAVGTNILLGGGTSASDQPLVVGIFTLAASKVIEVQYYCAATQAGNGLGNSVTSGEAEVYLECEITRLK